MRKGLYFYCPALREEETLLRRPPELLERDGVERPLPLLRDLTLLERLEDRPEPVLELDPLRDLELLLIGMIILHS